MDASQVKVGETYYFNNMGSVFQTECCPIVVVGNANWPNGQGFEVDLTRNGTRFRLVLDCEGFKPHQNV